MNFYTHTKHVIYLDQDSKNNAAVEIFSFLLKKLSPHISTEHIVLIHDGRCPPEHIEEVYHEALKKTSEVSIISEVMAQLMFISSCLNIKEIKGFTNITVVFFMDNFAYFYYLQNNDNYLKLYDEVRYSSDNLTRLKNVIISRHRTDLAVIVYNKMTGNMREAFNTEFFDVKFVAIENYEKTLHQGGIAKGLIKSDPNIGFLDIKDFYDPLFYYVGNTYHSLIKNYIYPPEKEITKQITVIPGSTIKVCSFIK